jgi:hypothetical protein
MRRLTVFTMISLAILSAGALLAAEATPTGKAVSATETAAVPAKAATPAAAPAQVPGPAKELDVDLSQLSPGKDAQPASPTDPCPPHGGTCESYGCSSSNCSNQDTGENACGWDGTFNPPEFQCPNKEHINVRTCTCNTPPNCFPHCPLCPNHSQTLVCQ